MAAIQYAVDGVTEEHDVLFNQYGDALANIFGIDDTGDEGPARFVIPKHSGSDPTTPEQGRIWMRTDLGDAGRIFFRHNAKTIPYLPLRQVVSSVLGSTVVTSTSFIDIFTFLTITTTGGRLKVYMCSGRADDGTVVVGQCQIDKGSAGQLVSIIRLVIDGVVVGDADFNGLFYAAGHFAIPLSSYIWNVYDVAAGGHTVKLQALVTTGSLSLTGLVVLEECE